MSKRDKQRAHEALWDGLRAFQSGPLQVSFNRSDGRWHLSVTRKDRCPSRDKIAGVRYRFVATHVEMVLVLPEEDDSNPTPFMFHLRELP